MSWQGQVNQPIGVAGIDSNGKIHTLDASQVYNLNASNIATGNLAIARLPGGGVNGANQLVQLDSSGNLPALDASSLTNLSAANITGSIPTANLAKATTSAFGIVQIGSNIDVSAGVISVPAATTSALGVVQPDGITNTIAGAKLVTLGIPNYQSSATYDVGNQIRGDGTNGLVGAIYTCKNNGTTGIFNIANWDIFGYAGTSNTVFGQSGLPLSATGTDNVAIGIGGLAALTTGVGNVAIGTQAAAAAAAVTGMVAIGFQAGSANTSSGVTAVGCRALKSADGTGNSAFGYYSLEACTTGSGNTAVGAIALPAAITGNNNTAVGGAALLSLTTGDNNTALGNEAGKALVGSQTRNTFIGNQSGLIMSTGLTNTLVGASSGSQITSGSYNTYLGAYDGAADATNSNIIAISDGQANIGIKIDTAGASLAANKFLATPDGATGPASPRSIVAADLPSIPNSLTTATSSDTASAIVARDINGDFSAGTITADLTGTASGNQTLQPSAVNGDFAVWNAAGQTVDSGVSLNTSTSLVGAANTNIPSTLAIKTYVDNAVTGGLNIIGSWDASTNTPTLTAGIGVQGNAYICNVAGTQTLPSGSPVAYYVGDVLFYSAGGIWDVIPAGNTVVSVNGQQGVVSLGLADMDDTTITGPAAAQLLVYNGTASKWENVDLTG